MPEKDWTRDADGEFVRWHRPPYYIKGVLNFVLPGEDRVSHDELRKRRGEYMKLRRRELRKSRAER